MQMTHFHASFLLQFDTRVSDCLPSTMAAAAHLMKDFKKMQTDPVEGCFVEFVSPDNVFAWRVFIEGPSDTPYEGGIFQAILEFPQDYPMMPPTLTFQSEFWHPNVYKDGKVCISILHPPGDDPMSGELASERWRPTQNVKSILLSVISMIADPNCSSPANVDASVEYRDKRTAFNDRVKALAEKAKKACPKRVVIPHPDTDPEERARALKKFKLMQQLDSSDHWLEDEDDDVIYDDDEEDDMLSEEGDDAPLSDEE